MEITVNFFGVLAEVTGTRLKVYSGIKSYDDLRLKIFDDFPEIVHYNYRICHNKVLNGNGSPALNDGDEISLLPPFEGG